MPERRVAVLLGRNPYYNREILRGISRYVAGEQDWYCQVTPIFVDTAETMMEWQPDGVIAQPFSDHDVEVLQRLGKPTVNVVNLRMDELPYPRVGFREESIGAAVAEHFIDRELKHFGFVGHPDYSYSVEREEGFRNAVKAAGYQCNVHHLIRPRAEGGGNWGAREEALRMWLRHMPKPAGVMVASDSSGAVLAHVCQELDVKVPDQVAMVGVDDDVVMCELTNPPLSSVGIPIRRAGLEAASLLAELMEGHPPPTRPILLPHSGLVVRQSSDGLATEDTEVAQAISFIRGNAHRGIRVEDVLNDVVVGRRTLERKFRNVLGRSVLAEIRRARVERAKRMLATTDLPVATVATRSGFSQVERFAVVFRQETGQTPTSYRRQFSC
jgi:LacI family transcriptional regulator